MTLLPLVPGTVSQAAESQKEFHGVWISYLEFQSRLKDPETGEMGFTEERFKKVVNNMFRDVANRNMNAVVVHVRPFGDAMYPSDIFPWSKFISGTQGVDPGFDPLEYMVEAAHKRGLEFHAWINPYRVTSGSTDVTKLSEDNIARKWLTDSSTKNDRRVLSFGGSLYYNPSDIWVQVLIKKGVEEIINNYDVDGIHFDDYFYPVLGSNYKNNFDAKEYKEYVKEFEEIGATPKSIADWRRNNVNVLIKRIYRMIKEKDESIVFGISPGGFLDYLLMDDRYYCDVETWLSKPGYIDYIAPQLYWSFSHSRFPYDKTLVRWQDLIKNDVKLYVGLATYKSGSKEEKEWKDNNLLRRMVEYGRETGKVDGYMHFRYEFLFKKTTKPGVEKMLEIIK